MRVTRFALLALVLALILSACGPALPPQPAAQLPAASPTATLPAPTATGTPEPTATTTAAATSTPAPAEPTAPTLTPTPKPAPQGIWTVYSNPNFIRALIVVDGKLWAATLGGVVSWDAGLDSPRLYTTQDGLAEIHANDLVYCPVSADLIYVAHENGKISYYNRAKQLWGTMSPRLPEGRSLGGLVSLYCDMKTGRLYAAGKHELGILNLKTNTWRIVGEAEGLRADRIRAVGASGETIWLAVGEEGAFLVQGRNVVSFKNLDNFPTGAINDLSMETDGSVWFGHPAGMIRFNSSDRSWAAFSTQFSPGMPFASVDQVEVGPDRRVWIASSTEGICPFNPLSDSCTTIYPALRSAKFTALVAGEDGMAYAGTDGQGVVVLLPDGVKRLTLPALIADNQVQAMAEDPLRRLWMVSPRGVQMMDLSTFDQTAVKVAPSPGALASENVAGMKRVSDGLWFFYSDRAQASLLKGEEWTQVTKAEGLTSVVRDAAEDLAGNTWLATETGLELWNGAQVLHGSVGKFLPKGAVNALLWQDSAMWVGGEMGLYRCSEFGCEERVPDLTVYAIAMDPNGGLLLGTQQGLFRYTDEQVYQWAIRMPGRLLLYPVVRSLAVDAGGQIWVGTDGDGLFLHNGERWFAFNTQTQLPADHILSLVIDSHNTLWVAATTTAEGGALVRYIP